MFYCLSIVIYIITITYLSNGILNFASIAPGSNPNNNKFVKKISLVSRGFGIIPIGFLSILLCKNRFLEGMSNSRSTNSPWKNDRHLEV